MKVDDWMLDEVEEFSRQRRGRPQAQTASPDQQIVMSHKGIE
jgi:hypothetical protein